MPSLPRFSPLRVVVPILAGMLLASFPAFAAEPGEHDFGGAIVVFTLEYEDDLLPPPPWALGEARVRRLGNVFFLTGVEPGAEPPAAKRHWIPLSDIVRLAEFDDVEAARAALEEEAAAEGDARSVVRPVGRRPRGEQAADHVLRPRARPAK